MYCSEKDKSATICEILSWLDAISTIACLFVYFIRHDILIYVTSFLEVISVGNGVG